MDNKIDSQSSCSVVNSVDVFDNVNPVNNNISDSSNVVNSINVKNLNKTSIKKNVRVLSDEVVINPVLDEEEKIKLRNAYPELNLKFKNKIYEEHAFSHVSRICERRIMLLRLNVVGDVDKVSLNKLGYDSELVDVGGRVTQNAFDLLHCTHVENPILSSRDNSRVLSDRASLQNRYNQIINGRPHPMVRFSLPIVENYLNDFSSYIDVVNNDSNQLSNLNNQYWCFKNSELCNHRAEKLMFLHSMYDISNQNIANIFQIKNAKFGYGTMLYDFNIFTDAVSGTIKDQKCKWTKHDDKITFYFEGDHSHVYTHLLSDYVNKFLYNKFVSTDGSVVVESELVNVRCGVQFFKLVRIDATSNSHILKDFSHHILQSTENKKYYQITYANPIADNLGSSVNKYVKKKIIVSKEYYNKVYSEVLRADNGRFTLNSIINMCTTLNGQININGTDFVRKNELSAVENFEFAHALFLNAFVTKYENFSMTDAMIDQIKKDRSINASCWLVLYYKIMYFLISICPFVFSRFVSNHIDVYDDINYNVFVKFVNNFSSFTRDKLVEVKDLTYEVSSKDFDVSKISASSNSYNVVKEFKFSESSCFVSLLSDSINYTCDKIFNSDVSIKGDGNCGIYSINYLTNNAENSVDFRKHVCDLARSNGVNLEHERKDHEWVSFVFMRFACLYLGYNLCMHEDLNVADKPRGRTFCDNKCDRTLHINFSKNHYTPVVVNGDAEVEVDDVIINNQVVKCSRSIYHSQVNYLQGDDATKAGFDYLTFLFCFLSLRIFGCRNNSSFKLSVLIYSCYSIVLPMIYYSIMSISGLFNVVKTYLLVINYIYLFIRFIFLSFDVLYIAYIILKVYMNNKINKTMVYVLFIVLLIVRFYSSYYLFVLCVLYIIGNYMELTVKKVCSIVFVVFMCSVLIYYFSWSTNADNATLNSGSYGSVTVSVSSSHYNNYNNMGEVIDSLFSKFYFDSCTDSYLRFSCSKVSVFSYQGFNMLLEHFYNKLRSIEFNNVYDNVVIEEVVSNSAVIDNGVSKLAMFGNAFYYVYDFICNLLKFIFLLFVFFLLCIYKDYFSGLSFSVHEEEDDPDDDASSVDTTDGVSSLFVSCVEEAPSNVDCSSVIDIVENEVALTSSVNNVNNSGVCKDLDGENFAVEVLNDIIGRVIASSNTCDTPPKTALDIFNDNMRKLSSLSAQGKDAIPTIVSGNVEEVVVDSKKNFRIVDIKGDIFSSGSKVMVHCISADARMSAGIAKTFDTYYPLMKQHILNNTPKVGDIVAYEVDDILIINCVSKLCYYNKPTIDSLTKCLIKLRDYCVLKDIKSLSMPRIGCGLDKLKWSDVRRVLVNLFCHLNIELFVYELESSVSEGGVVVNKTIITPSRDINTSDSYSKNTIVDPGRVLFTSKTGRNVTSNSLRHKIGSKKIWSYRLTHSLTESLNYYNSNSDYYSEYVCLVDDHRDFDIGVDVCVLCVKCNDVSLCKYYSDFRYVDISSNVNLNYTGNLLSSSEYKVFHPYVNGNINTYDYFLNCLKERIIIGRKTYDKLEVDHKFIVDKVYNSIVQCKGSSAQIDGVWARFCKSNPDFARVEIAVFDTVLNCFVTRNKFAYSHFVGSSGKITPVSWCDGKKYETTNFKYSDAYYVVSSMSDRYILTTSLLEICNDQDIIRNLSKVLAHSYDDQLPHFHMINGLPGCGKTTRVIRDFVLDSKNLIVCSTRNARDDVVERLRNREDIKNVRDVDRMLRKYVRTIDSIIINESVVHTDLRVDNVFVDEALMSHPGEIFAVYKITRASNIQLIGDVAQIPYVCRVSDYVPLFQQYPLDINERLYVSYRCPVDVIAAISSCYDGQVVSAGRLDRSLQYAYLSNINHVVKYSTFNNHKILVFKQSEKQQLNLLFGKNVVSTVHEFQGQQAQHVVLIRISDKPAEEIYQRMPYALVAISRHTKTFKYFTMCSSDDAVTKFIKMSLGKNLENFTQIKKQKGGYIFTEQVNCSANKYRSCSLFKDDLDYYDNLKLSFDLNTDITKSNKKYNTVYSGENVKDMEREIINIMTTVESGRGYRGNDIAFWDPDNTTKKLSRPLFDINNYNNYSFKQKYSVSDLQFEFDRVLPGNALRHHFDDALLVEKSDLTLHLDNLNFSGIQHVDIFKNFDRHLLPVLKTSCPVKRIETTKELLLAIQKRNANVPEMQGIVVKKDLAISMYKNFIDVYLDSEKFYLFNHFHNFEIYPTIMNVLKWWKASSFSDISYMNNDFVVDFFDMDLSKFDYTIKPTPKPTQSYSASVTHQALQTISAHKKFINSVFCPVIKIFKERLLMVLKKKYMIFTDESTDEFVDRMNYFCNPSKIYKLYKQGLIYGKELDISKYDKSQNYEALFLVCALMKLFGVPAEVVNFYFNCNLVSRMKNSKLKIHFFVNYQMKSGTAPTLIGNTIFTMAINAMYYPDRDTLFALFCGDDAFYILKNKEHGQRLLPDKSTHCSQLVNLEIKELDYKYFYFCSKFFIMGESTWYIVPDPIKLLNKLGRSDVLDYDHAEEYRISTQDNFKIVNEDCLFKLDYAVCERYKIKQTNIGLFVKLLYFISNKENFKTLFYQPSYYVKPDSSFVRYDLRRV